MHWTIAAPFFRESDPASFRWIDDFVPEGHSFKKIIRRDQSPLNWHKRSSRNTRLNEWIDYWQQNQETWQAVQGGIITVFPQLALMAALRKKATFKKTPLIAWCFNIGACYPGLKQVIARATLQDVDRFVVHSRRECKTVSHWLGLPIERFEFVPFQRAAIPITETEETANPFILAMGSANRDYQTLFQAVEKLNIRTVVVTGQHVVQNLNPPACVELRSGLSQQECLQLAQKARISVVPLLDISTAAGQVTIVEAMRMARPLIATNCVGSEDYIQHGKTGLLVQPYSVEQLTDAIDQLWTDAAVRHQLGQNAGEYAETYLSDEAAGRALGEILDQFS